MAKHKIQFSDLSSISFDNDWIVNNQQRVPYAQRFLPSDLLTIQFAIDTDSQLPKIQVIDMCTGRPFSYTITYKISGQTFIVEVAPGTQVLKSPQELGFPIADGYQFDGWTLNGEPVTEVEIKSNIIVEGSISIIMCSLNYYIADATPPEITEVYPWGTTVQLKSPEQLGMILPDNATFLGWIDLGVEITEITLYHDKFIEGEWMLPRVNLLRETRRWLNAQDLPKNTGYPAEEVDYLEMTKRRFTPGQESYQQVRPWDASLVEGSQVILSGVIESSKNVFFQALHSEYRIDKIYMDGEVIDVNGGTFLPGSHFFEIVATKRDGNVGSIRVWAVPIYGSTYVPRLLRFFKLEDVTGEPENRKRATPWVPNVDDRPDAEYVDSYYQLSADTDGRIYRFDASNTPITAFENPGAVDSLTVAGVSISRFGLTTLWFGLSYLDVQNLGGYWCMRGINIRKINTPIGVTTVGRNFIGNSGSISEFSPVATVILPMGLASTGIAVLSYRVTIKQLVIGNIDASLDGINSSSSFSQVSNTPDRTLVGTPIAIQRWKAKFTNTSNWSEQLAIRLNFNGMVLDESGQPISLRPKFWIYKNIATIDNLVALGYTEDSGEISAPSVCWIGQDDYEAISQIVVVVWADGYKETQIVINNIPAFPDDNSDTIVITIPTITLANKNTIVINRLFNSIVNTKVGDNSVEQIRILQSKLPTLREVNIDNSDLSNNLSLLYLTNKISIYNLNLNDYPEGNYELLFSFDDKEIARAPFVVRNELPYSMLIEYNNHENNFDTIFIPEQPFFTRIMAEFRPEDDIFGIDDSDFRDQDYSLHQMSARPTTVRKLSIGGENGVPNFIGNKVNRIFACSHVLLDGEKYLRVDGAQVERIVTGEDYPKYGFKLQVEKQEQGEFIVTYDSET